MRGWIGFSFRLAPGIYFRIGFSEWLPRLFPRLARATRKRGGSK
jgi:hypothetical protein